MPQLGGAAAEVAELFRKYRTPRNARFFEAMANHLSSLKGDPCLPMYFEFAITCNDRGRQIATLLQNYISLQGKRYLDVGCAYGGFLVAFAEQGAEAVGVDIDESLLKLGRYNLLDHDLDAPLLLKDITDAAELREFEEGFDVITCNDVIEHVNDPQALLSNISGLMHDESLVYFEIPNRYFPRSVLRDGHYQLFGITLLEHAEAKDYYALHAPGTPYTVGHYLDVDQYAEMFARSDLSFTVLDKSFGSTDVEAVLRDLAELRAYAQEGLGEVPAPLRSRVEERLWRYLAEVESAPRETAAQRRDFLVRYGAGFWQVLGRKKPVSHATPALHPAQVKAREKTPPDVASVSPASGTQAVAAPPQTARRNETVQIPEDFRGMPSHTGRCNVCGNDTSFFYTDEALYRESLACAHCLTTSRYRSIARGILRAIRELTGVEAGSLADLNPDLRRASLRIYDAQSPFNFRVCAYPIPDILACCKWLDVRTSAHKPEEPPGASLGANITNQNLEALTFPDNSFDIVITSDVLERTRLDYKAHWEIRRVLKPGGFYIFTERHFRDRSETFYHVAVVDPDDATKDLYLTGKEYHEDANSEEGRALSYRAYGTEIDRALAELGFTVEYTKKDFPEIGIYNTELFFCRLAK